MPSVGEGEREKLLRLRFRVSVLQDEENSVDGVWRQLHNNTNVLNDIKLQT